jgi:hypothetical protein
LTLIVETPLPHFRGDQVEDLAWIMERLPDPGHGAIAEEVISTARLLGSSEALPAGWPRR